MKVLVISRDGNKELVKGGLDVPDEATVKDLKNAIHQRASKYYPSRQRLTLPQKPDQRPVALSDSKRLSDYFQGTSSAVVVFKDLGPQVYYRTLFFFEYLGPLLIYPIFYLFPQVYALFGLPAVSPGHRVQKIAFYYWSLHYAKRIFETFFVHKFSHATSPLSNVFRNSFYYSLFAALISYCINHPLYKPVPETQALLGFGFGLLCQLANFYCHLLLSSLRPSDGKGGYQIPRGFLFDYITCANYTTEIYQWIGFNFATRVKPGYIFLFIGTMFMTNWAIGKQRRLNKLFDGKDGRPKYPKRWVFLPPVF